MKRVLHLIDTTGPGGAETVFVSLVTRLDPARWASVPVVMGPGWVGRTLEAHGHRPATITSQGRFDVRYLLHLRRFMRESSIDLVHAHLASVSLYGGTAAALSRIPALVTFHGRPDLEIGPLRLRLIASATHRIVFVSEALRAHAVEADLVPARRTTVIRNGIDLRRFCPGREAGTGLGRADPEEIVVGALGNIRPLKDYPTFLRTASELERREPGRFRFLVAGDTEHADYRELLELRGRLGLEERVSFLGFHSDPVAFLRGLDILLLTSSSEGFSLAAVQAMATGVPVVATRCGGPEEIIDDGETGLLRAVGDAVGLADGVQTLDRHAELRRRIAERARGRVLECFSLDTMIRSYESLYEEACG